MGRCDSIEYGLLWSSPDRALRQKLERHRAGEPASAQTAPPLPEGDMSGCSESLLADCA